jgi:hypothetical protein
MPYTKKPDSDNPRSMLDYDRLCNMMIVPGKSRFNISQLKKKSRYMGTEDLRQKRELSHPPSEC